VLFFFIGGGISGKAFSSCISDGMLFSRRAAACLLLRLLPRVITCFSCLKLALDHDADELLCLD